METDFGITEYLGERGASVPGVLKLMYSDFIVNEVSEDKSVTKLVDTSQLKDEAVEERDAPEDTEVDYPAHVPEELRVQLTEVYERKLRFALIATAGLTKDQRKEVHNFIRTRFRNKLVSETKPESIRVSRNVNHPFKRARWQTEKHADHCHFTLAKENKETSYALGIIAKFLNVNPDSFKTCGIKDRRAVTTQRVSVFRVEKEKLMALNARLRGMNVFECEYKDTPLQMGAHWGNRFNIVLREIPTDSKDLLNKRMEGMKEHGFINYFGTQRFGSCGTSTAQVGKLLLGRKWEEAVRLILNNPNARGTVGDAVNHWMTTGDAQAASKKLKGGQAYASIESNLLGTLARGRSWQQAILYLPTNIRSLYVHAYQSLLWNQVVSRRHREHGQVLIPGDVDHCGESLEGREGATVFDAHIPLPGETGEDKCHYVAEWYKEMLDADELTIASFTSLEDRFALGECYRQIYIRPEDVEWEFIEYEDPRAYLQDGLQDKAIPVEERKGSRLAIRASFNLPSGAYATVALREITHHDMGKQSMKDLCGITDDNICAETETDPALLTMKSEETTEKSDENNGEGDVVRETQKKEAVEEDREPETKRVKLEEVSATAEAN